MNDFVHPPFGSRAQRQEQTRILRAALASISAQRPAAAFDLDSTLLSNKVRQARIVREYGAATSDAFLAACTPDAVVSWDLRDTAILCGLTPAEAEAIYSDLKEFWRERFFTSAYCADDTPVEGARAFLEAVLEAGGEILYITGRHEEMRAGTLTSFRRAGFPLPGGAGFAGVASRVAQKGGAAEAERVQLWLKPNEADDDDRWKEICHQRLIALRGICCAFDNEPTHVNAYKQSFPEAVVVHLDTDHSRRPVEVRPDIPSIHDFVMEPG